MEPKICKCGAKNLKEYPFKCKNCSHMNYKSEVNETTEVDDIIKKIREIDFTYKPVEEEDLED